MLKKAGIDISDLTAYASAKKQGRPVTETLKFNANVECQRGVEMLLTR